MVVMPSSALPKQIHRYRVLSELGRGSMGRVYLALDPNIERRIALKILMPERLRGGGEEELRQRFIQEAKAAGGLSHPGIVTIHDADTDPATGCPYLAMEWVPGYSLKTLLRKQGPLATERAVSIAAQVARALDYAHRRDIVHRDVKPANLLVVGGESHLEGGQTGEGQEESHPEGGQIERVKVVDFGIAKLVSKSLTQPGRVLGSPYYMAPEQVRGLEVDGRSDLFSLGSVLYECLTGRVAFGGETVANVNHKILAVDPRPIEIYNPDLPQSLRAVVRRSLEKSPQDRYHSGAELAAALETVGAELAHGTGSDSFFAGPRGTADVAAAIALEASSTAMPEARSNGTIGLSSGQTKMNLPAGTELRGQVPGAELDRWRWPRALLLAVLMLIAVVLVGRSIPPRIWHEIFDKDPESGLATDPEPPVPLVLLEANGDDRGTGEAVATLPDGFDALPLAPAFAEGDKVVPAVAPENPPPPGEGSVDSPPGEGSIDSPPGGPPIRPPGELEAGTDSSSEVVPRVQVPPERAGDEPLSEPDPPALDEPSEPLRGDGPERADVEPLSEPDPPARDEPPDPLRGDGPERVADEPLSEPDPPPADEPSDPLRGDASEREGSETLPARRSAPPEPPKPPPVAMTDLEIVYQNRIKLAFFSVWIDGDRVLSARLQANFLQRIKGREHRWTIPVPEGKRSVEVHVSGISKQLEAQRKAWPVFSVESPQRLTVEPRSGSRQLDFLWEER